MSYAEDMLMNGCICFRCGDEIDFENEGGPNVCSDCLEEDDDE